MRKIMVNGFFIVIWGGVFLLFLVVTIGAVSDGIQLQHYQAGRCTIEAKHLISEPGGWNGITSITTYRPDLTFVVQTADGHSYQAEGYRYNTPVSDQNQRDAQAIVDQYEVGKTYSCWYDPANPTQAVLTQDFSWMDNLWPSIEFLIAMVVILCGLWFSRPRHRGTNQLELA